MSGPWARSRGPGFPIWLAYPPKQGQRIMEAYEERAAIMEHEAGLARHTAELFAYALLVDKLVPDGGEEMQAIARYRKDIPTLGEDILRQKDRARRIRRHWQRARGVALIWGLCSLGLTSPDKKKPGR